MKTLRYCCLVLFLLPSFPLWIWAQQEEYLDRTPQDIYNPATTLFTTQPRLQYNHSGYSSIAESTSIRDLHRFTLVQKQGYQLQDLGAMGTPIKSIFFTLPDEIGVRSGFQVYDLYFRGPDDLRYYDTKSPYTNVYVALGHFFDQVTDSLSDICHSRNITPGWNVGFDIRNIRADKGLLAKNWSEDEYVRSDGGDIFTYYKTGDRSYELLAYGSFMKHRVWDAAEWQKQQRTASAPTIDARWAGHLYHQVKWMPWLEPYHELDIARKAWGAELSSDGDNKSGKYSSLRPSREATKRQSQTRNWEVKNKVGLKGDWQRVFYSVHYRHRYSSFQAITKASELHEHSVGVQTRYQFKVPTESSHLAAEFMGPDLYKLQMGYKGRLLEIKGQRARYKPSFLVQNHSGQIFVPSTTSMLEGRLHLGGQGMQLLRHASFTRAEQPIYFKKTAQGLQTGQVHPEQASHHVDGLRYGTALNLMLGKHLHWDNALMTTRVWGPDAALLQVPKWCINSQVYYADRTAIGNGEIEGGMELRWKDSYYADGYDVVTQQFYLQNKTEVASYPIVDLFVNFRIKYWSAFLKLSHLNEGLLAPVYFVTPGYPGPRRGIDFGINCSFFD